MQFPVGTPSGGGEGRGRKSEKEAVRQKSSFCVQLTQDLHVVNSEALLESAKHSLLKTGEAQLISIDFSSTFMPALHKVLGCNNE